MRSTGALLYKVDQGRLGRSTHPVPRFASAVPGTVCDRHKKKAAVEDSVEVAMKAIGWFLVSSRSLESPMTRHVIWLVILFSSSLACRRPLQMAGRSCSSDLALAWLADRVSDLQTLGSVQKYTIRGSESREAPTHTRLAAQHTHANKEKKTPSQLNCSVRRLTRTAVLPSCVFFPCVSVDFSWALPSTHTRDRRSSPFFSARDALPS